MGDFSAEELFDAVDRAVVALLQRHGFTEPPVDALRLVQEAFGYSIQWEELDEDEPREYGDRPKPKPRGRELIFKPGHSVTAQCSLAARACAKELVPGILSKLGIVPGTENKSAQGQLVGLIAPRLLLPSRWFDSACRKASGDVLKLREIFEPCAYEWIALRQLDFEEPCLIAIVDDGTVTTRKSNFVAATKKLTVAEEICAAKVQETEEPQTVRRDDWTARGWPIPGGPFNRIILRSTADDV